MIVGKIPLHSPVPGRKPGTNEFLTQISIITAPEDSSRIVGACFCCPSYVLPRSWYVDILGVEPACQGRKLGKALLLHVTEFCRRKQVRLISLDTWPGNHLTSKDALSISLPESGSLSRRSYLPW